MVMPISSQTSDQVSAMFMSGPRKITQRMELKHNTTSTAEPTKSTSIKRSKQSTKKPVGVYLTELKISEYLITIFIEL